MKINGVIKQANTDEITLKLKDKVNIHELEQKTIHGHIYGNFEVYEPNTITKLQRKHIYALFGDYEDYTGTPLEAVESYFKYQFMMEEALDELPSLAANRMTKSTASRFIEYLVTTFIQLGIPFRKQQFYLTMDQNKMLYALTMKRLCVVCGKPGADIHHVDAIGMGANRHKHDHSKHEFLALCRSHHSESHNIGQREFMKKYHIKAIKLDNKHLKQIGVI